MGNGGQRSYLLDFPLATPHSPLPIFLRGAAMRKQNGGHSDLLEIQARIPAGDAVLDGDLMIPSGASGIAVFAHGSGSSRHSPRNRSVAHVIREAGLGTLLFDLLTREEESVDAFTRHL